MREIGDIGDATLARQFGDLLLVRGIENEIEFYETDNTYLVWIHEDGHLDKANALMATFLADPGAKEFKGVSGRAEKMRREGEAENARAAKQMRNRRETLQGMGMGSPKEMPLTIGLMAVCFVVTVITGFGQNTAILKWLSLWDPVRQLVGLELWRLVTCWFPHGDVLHLVFNLYWMWELGGQIERRQGWRFLAMVCLATGIAGALANGLIDGQSGIGISGVVYGLVGYIAARFFLRGDSGYRMSELLLGFFVVWAMLGFAGIIPGIANWAHLGGFVAGIGVELLMNKLRGAGRPTGS